MCRAVRHAHYRVVGHRGSIRPYSRDADAAGAQGVE
jgi:hypothetical protein